MSADPPRRPPGSQLFRSKSYHGPPRRKRGREVLEDITWIVNDPSSWLHEQAQARDGRVAVAAQGLGIAQAEEARADGEQRVAVAAVEQLQQGNSNGDDNGQPAAAARATSRPSLFLRPNLAAFSTALPRSNAHQLPTLYGLPRLTDNSSSPPSSPHLASTSSFSLGIPSGSGGGTSTSRSLSPSPSLSLRAPPLSRRNSASSLNGDSTRGTAMRRVRTHTGIRSAQPSPTMLQGPMEAHSIFTNPVSQSDSPRLGASTGPSLPTIAQSPERKKTRRYEDGEEDTDTELDDDHDEAGDAEPLI